MIQGAAPLAYAVGGALIWVASLAIAWAVGRRRVVRANDDQRIVQPSSPISIPDEHALAHARLAALWKAQGVAAPRDVADRRHAHRRHRHVGARARCRRVVVGVRRVGRGRGSRDRCGSARSAWRSRPRRASLLVPLIDRGRAGRCDRGGAAGQGAARVGERGLIAESARAAARAFTYRRDGTRCGVAGGRDNARGRGRRCDAASRHRRVATDDVGRWAVGAEYRDGAAAPPVPAGPRSTPRRWPARAARDRGAGHRASPAALASAALVGAFAAATAPARPSSTTRRQQPRDHARRAAVDDGRELRERGRAGRRVPCDPRPRIGGAHDRVGVRRASRRVPDRPDRVRRRARAGCSLEQGGAARCDAARAAAAAMPGPGVAGDRDARDRRPLPADALVLDRVERAARRRSVARWTANSCASTLLGERPSSRAQLVENSLRAREPRRGPASGGGSLAAASVRVLPRSAEAARWRESVCDAMERMRSVWKFVRGAGGETSRLWIAAGAIAIVFVSMAFHSCATLPSRPGRSAVRVNNVTGSMEVITQARGLVATSLPFGIHDVYHRARCHAWQSVSPARHREQQERARGREGAARSARPTARASTSTTLRSCSARSPARRTRTLRDSGLGHAYATSGCCRARARSCATEFGRESTISVSNPTSVRARPRIARASGVNKLLGEHGIEVTSIVTPRPRFSKEYEDLIENRNQAENQLAVIDSDLQRAKTGGAIASSARGGRARSEEQDHPDPARRSSRPQLATAVTTQARRRTARSATYKIEKLAAGEAARSAAKSKAGRAQGPARGPVRVAHARRSRPSAISRSSV